MMRSKKGTKVERLLAMEGRRIIEDALHAGLHSHSVYFSEKDTVRGIQLPKQSSGTKFFKVPYKNLKLWSTVTSCPGITGTILNFEIYIFEQN